MNILYLTIVYLLFPLFFFFFHIPILFAILL